MPGFREQQPPREITLPYDVETCEQRLRNGLIHGIALFQDGVTGRINRNNHLVAVQKKGMWRRIPAAVLVVDLFAEGSGTRLRYRFAHDWQRYTMILGCSIWVCAFSFGFAGLRDCTGDECPPPNWFFAAWGCLPIIIMLTVQHFTAPKERAYLTQWLEETCGTSLPRDAAP